MRFGYRFLVAFTAVLTMAGTAGMIFAGMQIWKAAGTQTIARSEHAFRWSNGIYEAEGTLSGGVLERMELSRVAGTE